MTTDGAAAANDTQIKHSWAQFFKKNVNVGDPKLARENKAAIEKLVTESKSLKIYVKIENGKIVECKSDDKDKIELDLTDGLNKDEAAKLGISIDKGINKIAAQGWALKEGDEGYQKEGKDTSVIDNDEILKFDAAIEAYATAHGIKPEEAIELYYACKEGEFGREDFKAVGEQRKAAETEITKQYETWKKKNGNENKTFSDFLIAKGVKPESEIAKNSPENAAGLNRLVFASRFKPEAQTKALGVKVPITTKYEGGYDAEKELAFARGEQKPASEPAKTDVPAGTSGTGTADRTAKPGATATAGGSDPSAQPAAVVKDPSAPATPAVRTKLTIDKKPNNWSVTAEFIRTNLKKDKVLIMAIGEGGYRIYRDEKDVYAEPIKPGDTVPASLNEILANALGKDDVKQNNTHSDYKEVRSLIQNQNNNQINRVVDISDTITISIDDAPSAPSAADKPAAQAKPDAANAAVGTATPTVNRKGDIAKAKELIAKSHIIPRNIAQAKAAEGNAKDALVILVAVASGEDSAKLINEARYNLSFAAGTRLFLEKKHDEALVELNSIEKKDSQVYYSMGKCYEDKGDNKAALEAYRKASETAYPTFKRQLRPIITRLERKVGSQPVAAALPGTMPAPVRLEMPTKNYGYQTPKLSFGFGSPSSRPDALPPLDAPPRGYQAPAPVPVVVTPPVAKAQSPVAPVVIAPAPQLGAVPDITPPAKLNESDLENVGNGPKVKDLYAKGVQLFNQGKYMEAADAFRSAEYAYCYEGKAGERKQQVRKPTQEILLARLAAESKAVGAKTFASRINPELPASLAMPVEYNPSTRLDAIKRDYPQAYESNKLGALKLQLDGRMNAEQKPIVDAALDLAKQSKYDLALKKLDTVPEYAKGANTVVAAREQIEKDNAAAEGKKADDARKAADAKQSAIAARQKERGAKMEPALKQAEELAREYESRGDKKTAAAIKARAIKVREDIDQDASPMAYTRDTASLDALLKKEGPRLAEIKKKEAAKTAAAPTTVADVPKTAAQPMVFEMVERPVAGPVARPMVEEEKINEFDSKTKLAIISQLRGIAAGYKEQYVTVKHNPAFSGKLVVTVQVNGEGKVVSAKVKSRGGDIPPDYERSILSSYKTTKFNGIKADPGKIYTVEVPLHFLTQ